MSKWLLSGMSFFILGLFCLWFSPPTANAKTLSVSQKITITATVLPYHYITVNKNDKIMEIVSNTDGEAHIKVFRYNVSGGNEINLNSHIYDQYMQLAGGQQKYGLLYKNQQTVITSKKNKSILAMLPLSGSHMNLIRYSLF